MNFQIHGWAVIGVLGAIKKAWGSGVVTTLQEGVSARNKETLEKTLHASSKYDASLLVEILLQLEEKKGRGTGSTFYGAGHGTGSLAIEVMFPVYKSIDNEARFFKSFPRLWDRMMVDAGTVEVAIFGNNTALVKICEFPSSEELWSQFWAGWIVGAVEKACGSRDVAATRNMFEGSDGVRHEIRISWRQPS